MPPTSLALSLASPDAWWGAGPCSTIYRKGPKSVAQKAAQLLRAKRKKMEKKAREGEREGIGALSVLVVDWERGRIESSERSRAEQSTGEGEGEGAGEAGKINFSFCKSHFVGGEEKTILATPGGIMLGKDRRTWCTHDRHAELGLG
ncbi:hypothetical protein CBOM_05728 [Ceraceosorus bombacis]|uniref:Uncharacterized protein n=1 Tax=Ceraceosorus bombacis TaxID=401625 RepID=A0A0P1BR75_9BASI|nr:hypothetical protein CBOM_05728 [Ceraceosorus bombacis]